MREAPGPLIAALSDRYRLERELGQGGMACNIAAEVADRLLSLKGRGREPSLASARAASPRAGLSRRPDGYQ